MQTKKIVDQLLRKASESKTDSKWKNSVEQKILNMLYVRSFEKWYEKDFMDAVEGEEGAKTDEQLLQDIHDMLH